MDRPTIHRKHGKQAVWLTSELFEFVPVVNVDTGEITGTSCALAAENIPWVSSVNYFERPASIILSGAVEQGHEVIVVALRCRRAGIAARRR